MDLRLERLSPEARGLGKLTRDLLTLYRAGATIVPTAAVCASVFWEWHRSGQIPDAVIRAILSSTADVLPAVGLLVRASVEDPFLGMEDKVRAERSLTGLRYAIERVYRSWGCPVARANRATLGISDESSAPMLLVQPIVRDLYSVVTRHATLGTLTNALDYGANVNNVIPSFTAAVSQLVAAADEALARPVKVTFTGDGHLKRIAVTSVADETMTDYGRFLALSDMARLGRLDGLAVLRAVKPHMLGYVSSYEIDSETRRGILALPASPGFAYGKVVFRSALLDHRGREFRVPSRNLRELPRPYIFVVDEVYPDDIELLESAAGAVSSWGGMTGHTAVICRGMGIPAVVGCGGCFRPRARTYELLEGGRVLEFSMALVDGVTGRVEFSSDETQLKARWEGEPSAGEFVQAVHNLLESYAATDIFSKLAIQEQQRLAAIRLRLKRIGYLKW